MKRILWLVVLALGIYGCIRWQMAIPSTSPFAKANVGALSAILGAAMISIVVQIGQVNVELYQRINDRIVSILMPLGVALMWGTTIFLTPGAVLSWLLAGSVTLCYWAWLRIRRSSQA